MRKLFGRFEHHKLDSLLISGQAAVLYGAATFSEDVDIWIKPTAPNARRLLKALADCRARVYKLTPPLTRGHLKAGQGFHFIIPARPTPLYLDVLGVPPRVGSFLSAWKRRCVMRTEWGVVPVVSVVDLIALKRTRRLSDYEVISHLVRAEIVRGGDATRARLRWAARNTFRAEDRMAFLERLGQRSTVLDCRRRIAEKIVSFQSRDAAYWERLTRALRRVRRSGRLLPEGLAVADLL
jgi:hypothetical protein